MAEFINTIDALGDEVVINTVIDRSITEFKDNQITSVSDAAFSGCTSLTEIELPEVTSVGQYAFGYCNFAELNMPKLKSAGNNAFRYNTSIKALDGPNITSLGTDCFGGCTSLESVNLPIMISSPSAGFSGCTSLKYVNVPLMRNLSNNTFNTCTALESIDLPSVTGAGGHGTFNDCRKLTSISLPLLKTMQTGSGVFQYCVALPVLDFPALTSIAGGSVFVGCLSLNKLLLRSEVGVVSLANSNFFNATPFTVGTGGKMYVPRALISAYQTATNWSTLYALGTCEFLAVEDVTADGTVTGELKKCTSISLDKTVLSFTGTGSQTLNATFIPALPYVDEIIWSSSDRSVVVVEDGVVTAVSNGSTIITVTCGGKTASCNVTVSGINHPVPYWSLSEAVTLDGVDDYIDTGITLFAEPNDFTIITDLSFLSTHSTNSIIDCSTRYGYANSGGFGGLYMIAANSNPVVQVKYRTANGLAGAWTTAKLSNWNKVSAIAIRFVAGAMDAIHYKNEKGEIVSVTITGVPEYAKTCATLTIGATKNASGTMEQFYKTTVNTFDIYSSALDDATISNILQAL